MQRAIEYILAVAEEGSISKAAERLYVGQPAISKMIASVEEALGIQLFIRDRTGMIPTEAGSLYLLYARRVAEVEKEMKQRFANMQKQEKVRINIAMTLNASSLLTDEINAELHKKISGYDLQIDNVLTKDIISVLRTGKYQYAVCPERILLSEGDLESRPLFYSSWLFITPRDYKLDGLSNTISGERTIDVELIRNQPLILQEESTNIRKEINELLSLSQNSEFNKRMQVANSLLAIENVQDGLGCAIVADTFRVYLDEKKVNIYRLAADTRVLTCLAYLKGRKITPQETEVMKAFCSILALKNEKPE